MDADTYVVEYMIRERATNARARARVAALLADGNGSQGPEPSRRSSQSVEDNVPKDALRTLAREIFHAFRDRTRIAKHS